MVGRGCRGVVNTDERRRVEIAHVPHVGTGIGDSGVVQLIQLVAQQEVDLIFGQPALVGVFGAAVAVRESCAGAALLVTSTIVSVSSLELKQISFPW